MYLFKLLFQDNLSNILMCVLWHLLICTALRAHIIVVEALYTILLLLLLLLLLSMQYFLWTTNCILLRAYTPMFRSLDTDRLRQCYLPAVYLKVALHLLIKGR